MARFKVCDTETTGLKEPMGVCDIAIAEIDKHFNVIKEDASLIDPEKPIEPGASGIHHITDDMVWAAPTLDEFLALSDQPFDVGDDELVIVGHNIQFDCRVLKDVLPRDYKKLCTLRLAKHFYPDNDNHKLQTLRYQFKLDAGTAHRAMGDVLACINFLKHLSFEFGHTLDELLEISQRPLSLDSRISFGKHKGSKLRDIPMQWVRWFCAQDGSDPDLRAAFAVRLQT